jgi:hypothetical protein
MLKILCMRIALKRSAYSTVRHNLTRAPTLRDRVVLADSMISLKGLAAGEIVHIIQHDKSDPTTPYQVRLADNSTPWFKYDELVLADPLSAQPPPWRPERNACCGSSCEDCVWILYRREVKEWRLKGGGPI